MTYYTRHQTPIQLRKMITDIHQAAGHSVRLICATPGVPRSSYFHAAAPTPMQSSDQETGQEIEVVFRRHCRRYGYRRIRQQLTDQGIVCAPARVRRIMRERGLKAIAPRHFIPRTSDGRVDKPSPNLLLNRPLPVRPNQAWAGDICQRAPALPFGLPAAGYLVPLGSFIPTSQGWLYLAVVLDLYSRKVIGWSLADHLRSSLVVDALQQALGSRPVSHSTLFHSDRGSQYGSVAYRNVLAKAGMDQSMSARANPYHNAWSESFIGTLKTEMLQDGCFENETDARTEIFEYIEIYYNNQRRHSSLNYLSPNRFETQIPSLT